MFAYLQAKNIFIDSDKFKTEEEGSPGFITGLHPKLTHKDKLNYTLCEESVDIGFKDDVTKDEGHSVEVINELTEFIKK
eukprot:12262930-Ditylum_brightwellii.AAC.1